MSKPKKFVVNGVEYRVTIGGSNVKISRPGFATVAPSVNEVAGVSSSEDFDDGYQCLPSNVASWIRRNSWRFTMSKGEQVLRLREPSIDDTMEYKAGNGCTTECGVKIWGIKSSPQSILSARHVVVLTELPDNHSTSITNSVEEAATEVMEIYLRNADPETTIWIEHWTPRLNIHESYDRVYLRFDGQRFRLDTSNGSGWSPLNETLLKEIGIL